jgi:hypothetical protein
VELDGSAVVVFYRLLDEQKVTQAIFRNENIRGTLFNCHRRLPPGEW